MEVLLVEDDGSFGYILKEYLEMNHFTVTWAKDGEAATRNLEKNNFDLIILDIMLPKKDGFSIAKEIKEHNPDLPFIFLTSRTLKVDKLKGFYLGADDYIVKPIDEEVFLAKVNAILRRTSGTQEGNEETNFKIGKYEFDFTNQRLIIDGIIRKLTSREASLLKVLCENKNNIVERRKILNTIWNNNDIFSRKSMDVFIFKLRKYLKDDPKVSITNIHGKGFLLEVNTDA